MLLKMSTPNLGPSLGTNFISIFTSAVLWGIACSQVFHYYTTRPKDSIWIKTMVAVMWASDSTHQTVTLVQLYNYCVTHFGDYDYLEIVDWTMPAQVVTVQSTATIAQVFYMFKIWTLSRSFGRKFIISIAALYLIELGMAAVVFYTVVTSEHLWANLLWNERLLSPVYGFVIFVTDACIAGMMCYLLQRHRTEYADTKSVINKLMVFVLSTNLLTACFALSFCIIYVVYPGMQYTVPLAQITVRLYANSLIAALNMRPYLRPEVPHPSEHSVWEVRAREGSVADSMFSSRLSEERNKSITSQNTQVVEVLPV